METKGLNPNLKEIEKLLKINLQRSIFHQATPEHNVSKLKGIGYTRKNKEESKKAKKSAKLQRKTNRKIANKKFRPTGSKKRK